MLSEEVFHYITRLIFHYECLDSNLSAAHPPHNVSSHINGFWAGRFTVNESHFHDPRGYIAREPPTRERNIPYRTMIFNVPVMVGHRTTDREATVGINGEGHGRLEGSHVLGHE